MIRKAGRGWRIGVSSIAAVLLVLATAPATLGADRAYWANGNDTISYANLDGSGGGGQLNLSGATPSGPRGVAVDPVAGRIYWANQGNDTISYANLDGSGGGGQLNVAGATIVKPHGLAIDPTAGRVYWANDTGNPISYAALDGSGGGQLPTPGTTPAEPYGVTVDTAAGTIYWANRVTDTISYAKLDGSGGGELNIAGSTPDKPHGVAIDPAAGRIYWANLGNTISYANLDGSGGGGELDLSGGDRGGPVGMAIDPAAGRIYWANLGSETISFAGLDGSGTGGKLDLTGATSSRPRFLALVQAPRAIGAPAISGGTALGSVLSCSEPSWLPDLPGAFLYRASQAVGHAWSRDGAGIAGAPATVYTAFATGAYRCHATASNRAGATSLASAPHDITAPAAAGGGGGGTTTAPPLAGARFAGSKSVIRVNRGGGFMFTFLAPEAVAGRATFTSVRKLRVSRERTARRRVVLARKPFAVRPGGTVTLAVRLSRANRRILRLNRTITTRVTVVLRNAAGSTATSSRKLTLAAPRLRRR